MTFLHSATYCMMLVTSALTPPLHAQQPPPPVPLPEIPASTTLTRPTPNTFAFRETDLLRRNGFNTARQANVVLHLLDRNGYPAPALQPDDIKLIVNGAERPKQVLPPGDTVFRAAPIVLLVFPPNQPILHSIGIQQAVKYFSSHPAEELPWKVAIFDADSTQTPFTNGRSQLLAWLAVSDHKTQPFQYTTDLAYSAGPHRNGPWLTAAERSIAAMQATEAPKVIIAYNPIYDGLYGENFRILADDDSAALINIARGIGAHIYIANAGGPELGLYSADASAHGFGPTSAIQQFRFATATAYHTSLVQQTAQETFGGYSNSLKDLAAQIQRDLDRNYTLTFDLTARDRDKGVPIIEVSLADRHQRLNITDVYPVTADSPVSHGIVSKELMASMFKAADHPVASPRFRITQHVDYFPLRDGLQPVLPMSAAVEWTGAGSAPANISVAEYVQNINLSLPVLEREVDAAWSGRGLSWERDGLLYPSKYLWRVVLHDDTGKIFASADHTILVGTPPNPALATSDLVLGKSCRDEAPNASSMLKRADLTPEERDKAHFLIDPMKASDCRVKPEPTATFSPTDSLRAFLRIYPSSKLAKKNQPETWTATYALRSSTGTVEFQRDLPFTVDSGTGYLASLTLPLATRGIQPGPHILDIHIHGPGIRKDLVQSRSLTIASPQKAETALP